jgi:hypothetical protein
VASKSSPLGSRCSASGRARCKRRGGREGNAAYSQFFGSVLQPAGGARVNERVAAPHSCRSVRVQRRHALAAAPAGATFPPLRQPPCSPPHPPLQWSSLRCHSSPSYQAPPRWALWRRQPPRCPPPPADMATAEAAHSYPAAVSTSSFTAAAAAQALRGGDGEANAVTPEEAAATLALALHNPRGASTVPSRLTRPGPLSPPSIHTPLALLLLYLGPLDLQCSRMSDPNFSVETKPRPPAGRDLRPGPPLHAELCPLPTAPNARRDRPPRPRCRGQRPARRCRCSCACSQPPCPPSPSVPA